ncbi:Hypothetical predicted protein [Olea europaea subsp. europaea]|uniref:Uncharacterized protein n=1 Tax=Olea europaea subsp. europaea TaxID=158383 RepID=A0A8S0UUK4_OLEEU|nr:Hypothetical predicted protein [Olea europaea subsp. europaea]
MNKSLYINHNKFHTLLLQFKMSRKVHSQGNVPFSWENKPGVSKVAPQEYGIDVQHHRLAPAKLPPPPCPPENGRASFHDMQILPLPPCAFQQQSRSGSRKGLKKIEDPFLIAYKECTKSTGKGKTTSREVDQGFGLIQKNVPVSVFSCKKSCSVMEESIIRLSQLPVSRSLRARDMEREKGSSL